MRLPLRLASSSQANAPAGLVLSAVASTAVFSATPLVIPEIIEVFAVDVGLTGFLSGAQLAGFVLTSFFAGRVTKPGRGVFVTALVLLAIANLASAVAPDFATLVGLRFLAGLSLGTVTWLAWFGVFGDPAKMGSIAVIGPIAGLVASPVLGLLVDVGSYKTAYLVLSIVALMPLARVPDFGDLRVEPKRQRHRGGALAAYVIIGCLFLLALGGSAVFVYSGLIASEVYNMSPLLFSIVLSANAAAGIPSARYRGPRNYPGGWFMVAGLAALLVASSGSAIVGSFALAVWGFAYWMGVPAAYQLLSERSRFPAERAGDAQAVMAVGRIIGPLVGGLLVAGGSYEVLGVAGGGLMILGGAIVFAIRVMPADPTSSAPSV